jgi:hypothetical protein
LSEYKQKSDALAKVMEEMIYKKNELSKRENKIG